MFTWLILASMLVVLHGLMVPRLMGRSLCNAVKRSHSYLPDFSHGSGASVRDWRLSALETGDEMASLTVPALKEMLKARGMPVSGKKAELLARLSEPSEVDEGGTGTPTASLLPKRSLFKRKILKRVTEEPVVVMDDAIEEEEEEEEEEEVTLNGKWDSTVAVKEEGDEAVLDGKFDSIKAAEEEEEIDMDGDWDDPLDAYMALGERILAKNKDNSYSDMQSEGFASREYEATRKHWRGDKRLSKVDHSGKSPEQMQGEIEEMIRQRTVHRDMREYRDADEIRDRLRFEYEVEIYDYKGIWEGPNGLQGSTPRNK